MADFILIDGDTVKFNPTFASAIVLVQNGSLTGGGKSTLNNTAVCIDGDEKNVSVPGCSYTMGSFTTPGTGTLKIDTLGADQTTKKTKSGGKPLLLKGSLFIAKFEVQQPAIDPSTGVSDPSPQYPGSGTFETVNDKWKGT